MTCEVFCKVGILFKNSMNAYYCTHGEHTNTKGMHSGIRGERDFERDVEVNSEVI